MLPVVECVTELMGEHVTLPRCGNCLADVDSLRISYLPEAIVEIVTFRGAACRACSTPLTRALVSGKHLFVRYEDYTNVPAER